MKHRITLILLILLVTGCTAEPAMVPTASPAPTMTVSPIPPTATIIPSPIPPTETPLPPTITYTPTPTPQPLLLRRKCGRDYIVNPDMPLQIFYGGWGVIGKDLADQWSTSLVIDLTIDGEIVEGTLQPPTHLLPYNCITSAEDVYWLYYMVTIPGLPPGDHYVSVKFNTLRVLTDGTGLNYGPGQILENTFKIITR